MCLIVDFKSFTKYNNYIYDLIRHVMKNQKLTLLRLQKEEKKLDQEPISNVLVTRKGLLNFHFCIFGLGEAYYGGYYHGCLQLHEDYPFSPPRLIFYTPSGRFETGKPICTTFTNFHKQTWTSAWNIRSMITATISFMLEESEGSIGSLKDGKAKRKKYAAESLKWNMNQDEFRQLFKSKNLRENVTINQMWIKQKETHKSGENMMVNASQSSNGKKEVIAKSNMLYLLYISLFIAIVLWAYLKSQ